MSEKTYNERLRFFRKNRDKTSGMALSLTYLPNKLCGINENAPKALFEIAPLISGSDNYNWDKDVKIIINLGQKEIADFICLAGKKVQEASFYHTPQKSDRPSVYVALNCKWNKKEVGGISSYSLGMYFDRNKEYKYSISLSSNEVEGLKIAFEEIYRLMLDWSNEISH